MKDANVFPGCSAPLRRPVGLARCCASAKATISFAWLLASGVAAMEPLTEGEMGAVSGRDGLALDLEFRFNADASRQPLSAGCASDPLAATECRLGLQLTAGNESEWLVLKGFFGAISVPALHLEASSTKTNPTAHEDLTRFEDGQGNRILDSPHDVTALQLALPEDLEIHDLTISGLSMEYDDGSLHGFQRHQSGNLGGLLVGNSQAGEPARISIQGRTVLYGF